MPRPLAAVLASVILCQGCYLGHGPVGRTIAYSTNGVIAAGGIALIVDAHVIQPGLFDLRPQIQQAGAIALIVGLVGLLINLAVDASDPVTPRRPPASPAPPGSHPVTGL